MSEKYAPEVGDFKKTSQWKTTFRRLCRNRGAVIGMVILFIILMMALFADLLFDYETMVEANNIPERLLAPCWAHPFGTDQFGRDMLARVVHGSRISLAVSASSVTFSLVVGGILGAISGYFGGWVDNIIMRVVAVFYCIPSMPVIIIIGVILIVPLTPVLEAPVLEPAFAQMLPALFGGLGVAFVSRNWKIAVAPVVLMLVLFIFVPALNAGTVGIMVPVSVLFTIAVSRLLYKRGVL